MKRIIDHFLVEWKKSEFRKPLLLRGARQVGKTYSVKQLGKTFEDFVMINFELSPEIATIFEKDLDPSRIIQSISLLIEQPIVPGKTLLFFDEIQEAPKAIKSLRYFYELMPALHLIAAGSFLDFIIRDIGLPVGRVESLYLYPMSFLEFLMAQDQDSLINAIFEQPLEKEFDETIHNKLLSIVGNYLAIGGMPEVIGYWIKHKDLAGCLKIQKNLLDAYRQDFNKYAKNKQIKYLDLLFRKIPHVVGKKFKYSEVGEGVQARELQPCLELLERAGIVNKITKTAGNGLPLGAEANLKFFKVLFMDVALCQVLLGLDMKDWLLNPLKQFINKGVIVEAFVGQELLAYSDPFSKADLYFWHREKRGSEAELDYLISKNENVIPVEVKSGATGHLKSLLSFLETHSNSPYGIRFSTHNFSKYENIHSYPLYAIKKALD